MTCRSPQTRARQAQWLRFPEPPALCAPEEREPDAPHPGRSRRGVRSHAAGKRAGHAMQAMVPPANPRIDRNRHPRPIQVDFHIATESPAYTGRDIGHPDSTHSRLSGLSAGYTTPAGSQGPLLASLGAMLSSSPVGHWRFVRHRAKPACV